MNSRTPFDECYKLLFSDPRMVKDLLVCIFSEKWVKKLDFSTLSKINKNYISKHFHKRENDLVWKVQWKKGEWLYLLIILEFQSAVDQHMAVRLLSYISLLYEDLLKSEAGLKKSGKLPPVLPLVLYNGKEPWTAPLTFEQFWPAELPAKLQIYQPNLTYWLLDETRCKIDLRYNHDVVSPLIALESEKANEQTMATIMHLTALLKGPTFDSLRRAYSVYINRVIKTNENAPDIDLNEEPEMFAENVKNWIQQEREKGVVEGEQIGMEKGIQQGMQKGALKIVISQLSEKFGTISENHLKIINSLSRAEVLELSKRLLKAQTIEEVLKGKKIH